MYIIVFVVVLSSIYFYFDTFVDIFQYDLIYPIYSL